MKTQTNYVPQDIHTDILLRLPVKALIRFRLVSKSWCTLLKDPNFMTTHLNHTSANHGYDLLIHTQDKNLAISLLSNKTLDVTLKIDTPSPKVLQPEVIVGSCNGLVCLYKDSMILLWNPATKEHKVLPSPCIGPPFLNPLLVRVSMGFGLHVNDYKVVRVVKFRSQVAAKVEVYSTRKGCWRVINDAIVPCDIEQRKCSVVVKGVPYWLGFGPFWPDTIFGPEREVRRDEFVLSFDMGNEVFRQVDVPDAKGSHFKYSKKLGVYNESIAIMYYPSYEQFDRLIEIWVMKDHGVDEGWDKVLRIGRPFSSLWTPLGCWENGMVILQNDSQQLLLYDPNIDKAKVVSVAPSPRFYTSVATYLESLVPVDGGTRI